MKDVVISPDLEELPEAVVKDVEISSSSSVNSSSIFINILYHLLAFTIKASRSGRLLLSLIVCRVPVVSTDLIFLETFCCYFSKNMLQSQF